MSTVLEEASSNSEYMNNDFEPQDFQDPEDQSQQQDEQSQQEEQLTPEEERKRLVRNRLKKATVALLLIGFVVFVIVDSVTNGYIRDGIDAFLEWIEDNPAAGCFVFIVVYFFATIFFIPGLILTLGAGFVFGNAFGLGAGVVIASAAVFVGASSGAIVAFLLGRYLLREWVEGLTKKYAIFEALDVAFEEKGLRIMTLLRLSPIIPFNAVNYIAGVTAISLRDYALALLAILPGTVLYVFVGSSAGSLTDSMEDDNMGPAVTIVVVVVGVVFGVIAIVITSIYARRELKKVVAAREEEKEAERRAAEESNTSEEMGSDEDEAAAPQEDLESPSASHVDASAEMEFDEEER